MAELKSMVGDSYHVVEGLRIEAGKVNEFARAVHNDNPAHRDEAAAEVQGFESIPAPLTFTRTAFFPRYRPEEHTGHTRSDRATEDEGLFPFDLGLDWGNTVHGEQEYEFHRPLTVGDELSGEMTLTDVSRRGRESGGEMTFVVYEIQYFDEAGDPVVTERATIIETIARTEADG